MTVYGNTAQFGGGIANEVVGAGNVTMETSIVAGDSANRGPDVSGTLTLYYPNLIQDIAGATIAYGNAPARQSIFGTSPGVGHLQNNGGPTQTLALLPGSPAIDLVPSTPGLCDQNQNTNYYFWLDQRGVKRPAKPGTPCDVGAYEHSS